VARGSETSARCLRARLLASRFILIIQFDAKICLHFGRSLILYCPRASRAPHGFGGAGERKNDGAGGAPIFRLPYGAKGFFRSRAAIKDGCDATRDLSQGWA
jgi:hypothetical protein